MTITYKEGVVFVPRDVKTGRTRTSENIWGQRTTIGQRITISLIPGENSGEDQVIFSSGHEVRGSEIKTDKMCKENGIGWYDPEAEPQYPNYRHRL